MYFISVNLIILEWRKKKAKKKKKKNSAHTHNGKSTLQNILKKVLQAFLQPKWNRNQLLSIHILNETNFIGEEKEEIIQGRNKGTPLK